MVIAIKSATFSASKSAPEAALETTYFMHFLKNVHGLRKIVFMKPHLYYFSLKDLRIFVFANAMQPFKAMKNIKNADPVLIINIFYH